MAASGGTWVKASTGGGANKRVFVPKGGPGPNAQVEVELTHPEPAGGWPAIDSVTKVKSLGGTTGAVLAKGPDGQLYVMKRGKYPEHITEEAAADLAYRALGVDVPECKLYQTPNGPVKLSRFLQGAELGSLHGDAKQAARAELRKQFAADALLGNYDVIGFDADNILWDGKRAWRVDNGGSLRIRARGKMKEGWDEYPTELWTMRDPAVNIQSAKVFGPLGMEEIVGQIHALGPKLKAAQSALALSPKAQAIVAKRITNLSHIAHVAEAFHEASGSWGEADRATRKYVEGLRAGKYERLAGRGQALAWYKGHGG